MHYGDCKEMTIQVYDFEIPVLVEYEFTFHHDRAYGADYDGNRGESVYILTETLATVYDQHGKNITEKLKENYPGAYKGILEELEGDVFDRVTWGLL